MMNVAHTRLSGLINSTAKKENNNVDRYLADTTRNLCSMIRSNLNTAPQHSWYSRQDVSPKKKQNLFLPNLLWKISSHDKSWLKTAAIACYLLHRFFRFFCLYFIVLFHDFFKIYKSGNIHIILNSNLIKVGISVKNVNSILLIFSKKCGI